MIINFHFLPHSLLEHGDLTSCKYFVTNFIMISSDYDRIMSMSFKILRKNNYLPSMIFYY